MNFNVIRSGFHLAAMHNRGLTHKVPSLYKLPSCIVELEVVARVRWLEQEAVRGDVEHGEGHGRTVVFAANVAAADEVADVLAEVGLEPLLYHREVSPQDRASALDAIRTRCLHQSLDPSNARHCISRRGSAWVV